MRTGFALLVIASLVAGLAACSSHATKTKATAAAESVPIFRPGWSLPCLNVVGTVRLSAKIGAVPEITEELDSLGQSAGLKAVDLNLGRNSAEVIFEKSARTARKTATAAHFWARNYRVPVTARRWRNVVIIFEKRPKADEESAVVGCMNTSRPAPKPLLREIKSVLTSKRACGSAVYKGPCQKMIVPDGTISPAHPSYAAVTAAQPFEGEYVGDSLILRRANGGWRVVSEGSDEVGCGVVPPAVLRDLGFSCQLYRTKS
jgi:hypothetical protein